MLSDFRETLKIMLAVAEVILDAEEVGAMSLLNVPEGFLDFSIIRIETLRNFLGLEPEQSMCFGDFINRFGEPLKAAFVGLIAVFEPALRVRCYPVLLPLRLQ